MQTSHRWTAVIFAVVVAARMGVAADPKNPAFTDPKKAGPDFALQGEYKGKTLTEEGEKVFGAQIVALGNGKFKIVGFPGGLPGDGWKRGDEQLTFEAEAKNGRLEIDADEATVVVEKGAITIEAGGEKVGTLKKVHRKSKTLGKKPPAGAVVLFDGKKESLSNWNGAKIVEGKYLGATNLSSKKGFGDHHLHIEFRTPFMPKSRGQGRGNSGVYVQSRFEVQVLDSFGLDGKNNECGGIYSVSAPAVNMCLPPLSWQTYDIDFTAAKYDGNKKVKNARITVRHNGVVIHDNVELPKGTPGRLPEGPEPQGVFMQDHGNPVAFRNVWVVEK